LQGWLFGSAGEPGFGGVLATWLMLVALTQVVSGWSLHCGAFFAVSLGQVGSAIVTNAVQLAGGFIAHDGRWLILGSILGQATLLLLTTWITLRRSGAPAWPAACVDRIRHLAARHWRFPLLSTPYTFCSLARDRGPILVLGTFASGTDVGLYSQAWRIMNVPVGISSSAVRPVVFHAAAKNGLAAQEAHVGRILAAIVVLGAPWLAIFAFHAEALFALVLGESWRGAGPLAALMIVPVFLSALSNWFDRFFDLTGRQEINLLVDFATAAASIGALAAALAAGAGVLTAVAIQCAVLAVSEAALILLAYRVAGFRLPILGRLLLMGVAIAAAFAIGLRMTDAWMASASIVLAASIVAIVVGGFAAWPLLRGMR
jgi:O-antigen/teichoic acid export membrane protein